MIIASTMRRKVGNVEVMNRKCLRCIGVIGSFETSDVHVEDFVVLEISWGFAGEDAEHREDQDGDTHQLGNDCGIHLGDETR